MKASEYVHCIDLARHGDLEAFARLVRGFQEVVTGTAYGWLGDAEASRDVAQEAFLDAYLHLHQLRDPAAFPAWLRRIVRKHCDRSTRRRGWQSPAGPTPHQASGEPLDVGRLDEASALRLAVGALPPPERMVVALQYFAELSGAEAADFLELPLSTVKKRLRSARARLRDQGEYLMSRSLDHLKRSHRGGLAEAHLADRVTFFLAIRAGDRARVRDMLERRPDLVDAEQDWDAELVTGGVLPFPSRATALITAVERDDVALLTLLLDAGADVDGRCGCTTAESPVWAATLLDRPRHLEVLLRRGADPDRPSASGTRPLHVAAMRGREQVADLLLAHGADLAASDRSGRTPGDWARLNGHRRLTQRLASPAAHPAATAGVRLEQPAGAESTSALFTGIRALDLFCPLPRGGVVRVPFMAGVGMVVLLGELCARIDRTPRGRALWSGFAQRPFDVTDWRAEMAELGILDRVTHSLAELDAAPDARREAFVRGIEEAERLRDGGHHVLLVLLCEQGFEAEIDASLPRLLEVGSGAGSLTTVMVTPFPERPEATWDDPIPPYAAQLRLDRRRAARGLYPAVDPERCWSRVLNDAGVGSDHMRIARAARRVLADYVNGDPELAGLAAGAAADPHSIGARADGGAGDQDRARRLLRHLVQPFYVAEPFTGRPGSWVSQDELLADVAAIVEP